MEEEGEVSYQLHPWPPPPHLLQRLHRGEAPQGGHRQHPRGPGPGERGEGGAPVDAGHAVHQHPLPARQVAGDQLQERGEELLQ